MPNKTTYGYDVPMNVMDSEVRVATGKACDMLGVHPNTLRRWVKEGHIDATLTPTGQRRFLISDLKEVLKGKKAS